MHRDEEGQYFHRPFIAAGYVFLEMSEDKGNRTAQHAPKPTERPPLGKRLWEWTGFAEKSGWNWLELLSALAIPVVLAAAGLYFQSQLDQRQRQIEERRAELEREIEDQRAQHATLQTYLDQMGTLLLDRNLRNASEDSDVRRLARARTLVVLDALGSDRQDRVFRFLEETELIQFRLPDRPPIISLKYASLRDLELTGKQLLRGTDLTQATLSGGDLSEAHLEGTDLSGAHLGGADLTGAYLMDAKLCGAYLYDTDLGGADLSGADLSDAEGRFESGARMIRTRLEGANLDGADLTNAKVTEEQLREAESLKGATMPDGQKYEDWLRRKGRGGEENNGNS
jgi:uncharacterized protein YjbI with pentapeptide repeats